jgi:hypothetical protein
MFLSIPKNTHRITAINASVRVSAVLLYLLYIFSLSSVVCVGSIRRKKMSTIDLARAVCAIAFVGALAEFKYCVIGSELALN